jgi:pimeloyl-ACP methyl ester carboxylesterase
MVKTKENPRGTPIEVFNGLRAALAANRAEFYLGFASGPFYGFNRTNAKVSQAVIQNWWRQGMMGGAKAQYDSIKAFSETDQTDDLRAITVPTLILQGDDDQVVPLEMSSTGDALAPLLFSLSYLLDNGWSLAPDVPPSGGETLSRNLSKPYAQQRTSSRP